MESGIMVIELKDVVKNYADFKLDKVSFSVPEGSVCGFIGQNGAGKTTTIRLILDIIKSDAGEIRVFGEKVGKNSAHLREDIGVVFDEMGFHEFMTGRDINLMMKNIYKRWDEEVFFGYLKEFSLPSKKKCGAFSRGMRMKLQIAAALSHQAKLLIMDEPTSGLDPIVRNEMVNIFREFVIREDHTILMSSHITGDLERIADEVVFIDGGRIVLAGNKDELMESHAIMKCTAEEADTVDKALIVSREDTPYGVSLLVNDADAAAKKHPDMLTERATLEDIMIYYVNEKSRERAA